MPPSRGLSLLLPEKFVKGSRAPFLHNSWRLIKLLGLSVCYEKEGDIKLPSCQALG